MTFTQPNIDQFLTNGYVVLRDGFSRAVAEAGRTFIWNRIGETWEGCQTSGQPMIHLQRNFKGAPFDQIMNPRLTQAIDELLGAGRWRFDEGYGWWPILFPGFPGPGGWHIDGLARHRLAEPEKGLTTLFLFSDVGADDGGTPLVPGSHRTIARLLAAAEPSGLSGAELSKLLPQAPEPVVSVAGRAGDVAFLHPFLLHGFGPNTGGRIRFACNPLIRLVSPLNCRRADGAHSPVEEAVRRAVHDS